MDLEEIYGAFYRDLLAYCLAMTKNRSSAEDLVQETYLRAAVLQLVGKLPDGERTLFSMRYFEGYNARELGELFELPAATVRSRLASARRPRLYWVSAA